MIERRYHADARDAGTRAGDVLKNPEGFQAFWAQYPLKVGRLAAIKVWNWMNPDAALVAKMLTTIAWQRRSQPWLDGYIPHPKTWLRQGRWDDEPPEPLREVWRQVACPHTPRCESWTACAIRARILAGKAMP